MSLLMTQRELRQSAALAYSRPIKERSERRELRTWDSIEGIDVEEKMAITLFKTHGLKQTAPPLPPKLKHKEHYEQPTNLLMQRKK